jgi:6-phosphogluconolactonase (cycloisomerase 2 family)
MQRRIPLLLAGLSLMTALHGCGGGGGGGSANSNNPVTVPAVTSGVTALGTNAAITAQWSTVPQATSYTVFVGTSSGNYTTTVSAISALSYSVPNLTNGTEYYIAVAGQNSAGIGAKSNEVTAAPSNEIAYVANQTSGTISAFQVNMLNGNLTELQGSPYTAAAGTYSLTANGSSTYLYSANSAAGNVSVFSIGATNGALTEVSGSPFVAGKSPASVAVSGAYVYVINYGDNGSPESEYGISGFSTNSSGYLSPTPGSPYTVGEYPTSAATISGSNLLYVANQGLGGLYGYQINQATGALAAAQGSPYSVASIASAYAVASYGSNLYVAEYFPGSSPVAQLTVDTTTGDLTAIQGSTPQSGADSQSIAISPGGQFVCIQNYYAPVTISVFARDEMTGALTEIAGSPFNVGAGALGNGYGLAIDPSGKFLYSLATAGGVYIFSINQSIGAISLQSQPTFSSLSGANNMDIVSLPTP